MGVQGLWVFLAPSGRKISIESLEGKVLAIDASIWAIQLLRGLPVEDYGMSSGVGHIQGFFRRICKLLFFGIKPVFVFDGSTPSLKRQTVIKRREQREKQVLYRL